MLTHTVGPLRLPTLLDVDRQYLQLVTKILLNGVPSKDRTGVGTISVFGERLEFDLQQNFPIVSVKKTNWKAATDEMAWMLRGESSTRTLNSKIWDEWRGNNYRDMRPVRLVAVRPTIASIKYEGPLSHKAKEGEDSRLSSTWTSMMRRCYDPNHHRFNLYGAKGVFVCERWHTYSNFESDCRLLPSWDFKEKHWSEFELDKDYYGAGYYGPDSCHWVHTSENNKIAGNPIKVTNCEGVETIFISPNDAAKATGMSRSCVYRALNQEDGVPENSKGANKAFVGWLFERTSPPDGFLYRYEEPDFGDLGPIYGRQWRHWGQDQITQLIHSLRENPGGRRHILSAWNHADVPEMSLAPCHMMAQFYVNQKDKTLSCMMTQRSCDVFLGLPFNIVGYAFLTHVLADICGYTVGKLIMSIGDTHIYANHLEAVETLLKQGLQPNSELNRPHLFHLKPIPKDWNDIPGDIDAYYKVIDYVPNKFIPAPVAV